MLRTRGYVVWFVAVLIRNSVGKITDFCLRQGKGGHTSPPNFSGSASPPPPTCKDGQPPEKCQERATCTNCFKDNYFFFDRCLGFFQACTISLNGLPKTKNSEVVLKLKHMTLNKDLVAEVVKRLVEIQRFYQKEVHYMCVMMKLKSQPKQDR